MKTTYLHYSAFSCSIVSIYMQHMCKQGSEANSGVWQWSRHCQVYLWHLVLALLCQEDAVFSFYLLAQRNHRHLSVRKILLLLTHDQHAC